MLQNVLLMLMINYLDCITEVLLDIFQSKTPFIYFGELINIT